MTALEYLEQVEELDIDLEDKQENINNLQSLLVMPSGGNGERVQSSPDPDKFGKIEAEIDEIKRAYDVVWDELIDLKHEIITKINGLSKVNYKRILKKRYLEYKTFRAISTEMRRSERYIYTLHDEALQEFAEMYHYKLV